MDSDARINVVNEYHNAAGNSKEEEDISVVIRHDLGENVSFYHSRRFLYFFELLQSVKVIAEYDESTITVKLERKA